MSFKSSRDMTITHRDFFRLLPRALGGLDYEQNANTISVRQDEKEVLIRISEQGVRQIALLKLPRTQVEIELLGFSDDEAKRFLSRFDLAYQKGGG